MPSLEIMELWGASKEDACIFRYQRQKCRRSTITLLSTWGGRIGAEATAQWGLMDIRHNICSGLIVESVCWDTSLITDHLAILEYLVLKKEVVMETSSEQMKIEMS